MWLILGDMPSEPLLERRPGQLGVRSREQRTAGGPKFGCVPGRRRAIVTAC